MHLSDSDRCKILLTFDKCTKRHFKVTRWRPGSAFLLNTFAKIGSSNPPLSDSDWGEWCYRFLEARFYDHGVASHMHM